MVLPLLFSRQPEGLRDVVLHTRHIARRPGARFLFEPCEPRWLLSVYAQVNFQPATPTAPAPAGFVVDSGQAFGNRGNGYSYGWSGDNTANIRERPSTGSADNRYDTLAMMQKDG